MNEEPKRGKGRSVWPRVGAVISAFAALVGIVTGVVAIWPSGNGAESPPSGKLVELSHSDDATLSEVEGTVPDETKCPGVEKLPRYRVGAPAPVATATLGGLLAQETTAPGESGGGEDGGGGGTTDPGTVPPGIEPPEIEPTDPEERTDPADPTQRVEAPTVDELAEVADVSEPRVAQLMFNPPPGQEEDVDEADVQTIINGTRLDRAGAAGAASATGGLEPLGWVIEVSTLLEQLSGKCAYVQWSVYDARTRRRVNKSWLIDRRGVRFIARGSPDRRSASFWVPIPREEGKYHVKVALYDAQATRLHVRRVKNLR